MPNVFVVEFPVRLAGVGTDSTLYYASLPYISKSTDTPANQYCAPRIMHPGSYERHFWKPGQTSGRATIAIGYLELNNQDGGFDFLLDCSVDGRIINIKYGDQAAAYSTFTLIYTAVSTGMEFYEDTVHLNLKDFVSDLYDKPIQNTRYLGNNSLPAGREGVSDLKDKFKPMLFGYARQFEPVCVNTSLLIYELSHIQIGTSVPLLVYNGLALLAASGTSQASAAALEASAPPAGLYTYYRGSSTEGAYIKLGSSPGTLPITAEAAGFSGYTVLQAVYDVLNQMIPWDATTKANLLAGLTTSFTDTIGGAFWAGTEEVTAGAAIDEILSGLSATLIISRTSNFKIVQFAAPGSSVYSFVASDIISFSISAEQTTVAPPYEVVVNYGKIWRGVFSDPEMASSLSQSAKNAAKKQYASATATDTTCWNPVAKTGNHPQAQSIQRYISSGTNSYTAAAAEAARLLAAMTPTNFNRRYGSFTVSTWKLAVTTIDLGDTITVTYPRFGFASSKLVVITGLVVDLQNEQLEIFWWG